MKTVQVEIYQLQEDKYCTIRFRLYDVSRVVKISGS